MRTTAFIHTEKPEEWQEIFIFAFAEDSLTGDGLTFIKEGPTLNLTAPSCAESSKKDLCRKD